MPFFSLKILAHFALCPLVTDPAALSSEEFYFLRRIADFWEEEEYEIAKVQMEKFLSQHPDSKYVTQVQLCLGNLFFHEENYKEALHSYACISDPEFQGEVFSNRLQCFYRLGDYASLMQLCEASLDDLEKRKIATYFLAISLYAQALSTTNPETLQLLAQKGEPYFQTLIEEKASLEIAKAYAHLCTLLKDYPKAAKLYAEIAERLPDEKEEILLQAALAKSKYDVEGALLLLEELKSKEGKWGGEASYLRLELLFSTGQFAKIAEEKDELFEGLPEKRQKEAHLLFGRSLLAIGKQQEAIVTLKNAMNQSPYAKEALHSLIEAAYQTSDLDTLDFVLHELSSQKEVGPLALQAHLCKCSLLKNQKRWDEARNELNFLPEDASSCLEKIDLEYQAGNFTLVHEEGDLFLERYPKNPLTPFVLRALVAASQALNEDYLPYLQLALHEPALFSSSERVHFEFLLAKALYDKGKNEEAAHHLESLLSHGDSFVEEGDSWLLFSLCNQDHPETFCRLAEMGISKGGTLCDPASLALSLYNTYLELSNHEKCAEHLFKAFELQAEISEENLLWLGEWFFTKNPHHAEKIFATLHNELALYQLARLYQMRNASDLEQETLEKLQMLYQSDEEKEWEWRGEVEFQQVELYLKAKEIEKAHSLLDQILHSNYTPRAIQEKAKLEWARLKANENDSNANVEAAALFKELIQQRELINEPLHLEAALEYVDLLGTHPKKRLTLLEKIHKDFTSNADLLAQDYQAARSKLEEKNRIYEAYLQWIEAEILWTKSLIDLDAQQQKELQTNAKELFLKYSERGEFPLLQTRALQRLQNAQ
ncbi:MAG TPA: hypothetical protein VJK48_01345 [Chlamydiales bacterium]|nr:hypothetical protein [Chlamydiales bacterium]